MKTAGGILPALAGDLLRAQTRRGDAVAVALSGGMDSAALLDAVLESAPGREVFACHVNHGLGGAAADSWERFCRELCESRGVSLFVRRASPEAGEGGTEKWARNVRMRAFAGLPVRAVLAAHHADDQAETVLFRLLRGAGAQGLGAMRAAAPLPGSPDKLLLRPWLGVPLGEIAGYARARRLRWAEDGDNFNLARRRNFLRRRALPVLREYFPECGRTLSAAAARLDSASVLLAALADEDEKKAGAAEGERGMDLSYFRAAGLLRLQNWLYSRALRGPAKFSERGLSEAARQIMSAGRGGLSVRFAGLNVRVWRGRLYCDSLPPPPPFFRAKLAAGRERHEMPELGGALILRRGGALCGGGALFAQLRRGGERLDLDGRGRLVSDLLRGANIAPWRRRRMPLLFSGGTLAAVPGVAVAAAFRAGRGESGIDCRMEWF